MSTATTVYDHEFEADDRPHSALCRHCHLAEASHIRRRGDPPPPPGRPPGSGESDEPVPEEDLPMGSTFEINYLDINWLMPPRKPGQ
jgi:hypothetical protein